jgi:hypothetical protein
MPTSRTYFRRLARQLVRRTELAVNLSTMTDLEYGDRKIMVVDLVDNPIVTLPDAE